MSCTYCNGSEAIFYHDKYNCALIDGDGTMRVSVNGAETKFEVDRCPMCGRLFKGVNYLNLRHGDDIWYADVEEGVVEHGTIHSVAIKNNKVETFSVNFDNGDFDEFSGAGLGTHYFMNKIDAEGALTHPVEEFAGIENIPDHNKLCAGDEVWYVDVDANQRHIEHAVVEYVEIENGDVDWFSAKFDNGDTDVFGPCNLGKSHFKSYAAAQAAWDKKHIVAK